MNAHDEDFAALSTLWLRSHEPLDDAPIRRMIAAHRTRLAAVAAGEAALVAAFAWLTWTMLGDGIGAWEAVWAITLWTFAVVAAGFAWWNRRGMWHAMGRSVEEYRRARAERQVRSARFACILFISEVAVVSAELVWFDRFTVTAALILAAAALPIGAWWLWVTRRQSPRSRHTPSA